MKSYVVFMRYLLCVGLITAISCVRAMSPQDVVDTYYDADNGVLDLQKIDSTEFDDQFVSELEKLLPAVREIKFGVDRPITMLPSQGRLHKINFGEMVDTILAESFDALIKNRESMRIVEVVTQDDDTFYTHYFDVTLPDDARATLSFLGEKWFDPNNRLPIKQIIFYTIDLAERKVVREDLVIEQPFAVDSDGYVVPVDEPSASPTLAELIERSYNRERQAFSWLQDPIEDADVFFDTLFSCAPDVISIAILHTNLSRVPESINRFSQLKYLGLIGNQLTTLPETISELGSLETLQIDTNQFVELPSSIGSLANLRHLSASRNLVEVIASSIGNLVNLTQLDVMINKISSVSDSLAQLKNLKMLNLGKNELTSLSDKLVSGLSSLEYLFLHNNQLSVLPEALSELPHLKLVNAADNRLEVWPDELLKKNIRMFLSGNVAIVGPRDTDIEALRNRFGVDGFYESGDGWFRFENLSDSENAEGFFAELARFMPKKLSIKKFNVAYLPENIRALKRLEYFAVTKTGLEVLPDEIGVLNRLDFLNISNNNVSMLPASFGNLTELAKLYLAHNQFKQVPAVISRLQNLRVLDVSENPLTDIPEFIGELPHLETLLISQNQLDMLPASIRNRKDVQLYVDGEVQEV
jgi:Leucine-rich repeat (LRR) protein